VINYVSVSLGIIRRLKEKNCGPQDQVLCRLWYSKVTTVD